MIGIGAANLAAGLFQEFPVSTSGSRTAVAERSGARSQLTGMIGAALIILMIVLVPGLFGNLPQPALAAAVITAPLSVADIPGTARLWRQRKAELALSITASLGVALLGMLPGIAIAVALSILNVFRLAWRPYDTELGRVDGLPGYHDVHSYPPPSSCRAWSSTDLTPPVLRQREDVPRCGPAKAGRSRAAARVDLDRRGAGDRRGHHRGRRADQPRRDTERPGRRGTSPTPTTRSAADSTSSATCSARSPTSRSPRESDSAATAEARRLRAAGSAVALYPGAVLAGGFMRPAAVDAQPARRDHVLARDHRGPERAGGDEEQPGTQRC
jgi:hypothetical protein